MKPEQSELFEGIKRPSARERKKAEAVALARQSRDAGEQDIGYNARPFTVTNLPVRPASGLQVWERWNGTHYLRIEAAAGQVLPYGQDRLVLLLLATMAVQQRSRVIRLGTASEILRLFGKSEAGVNYEMLAQSFNRIMSASISWGTTGVKRGTMRMIEKSRMLLLEHFRIWANDKTGRVAGGPYENIVTLSQRFFDEIVAHPIPVDMDVVRGLLDSPAALDFYAWLAYRAYRVPPGEEAAVPLFGEDGLQGQLGSQVERPRKFRQQVVEWLARVRGYWPDCPGRMSEDGQDLLIVRGLAIRTCLVEKL